MNNLAESTASKAPGREISRRGPNTPRRLRITTVIRFFYTTSDSGVPLVRLPGSDTETVIDTTAGKALSDFLNALHKHPELESMMWTAPIEETNCVLIFLSWKEGKEPSVPFKSTETFGQVSSTSPLRAFDSYLRSPAEIFHMSFDPDNGSLGQYTYRPVHQTMIVEMVTWRFPAHILPTNSEERALGLLKLDGGLETVGVRPLSPRVSEILSCHSAWIVNFPLDGSVSTEPIEKTRVFLIGWRSLDVEARVKDRTGFWGKPKEAEQMTRQGSLLETQGEYDREFAAVQREWEARGVEVKSVHLKFHGFP